MYSKAKIFNIALGALLLSRQITDADTDTSNEAKVLNTHWNTALRSALEDMDLDSTATEVTLELIEEDPTDLWGYAYKYPSNCSFLRRIVSGERMDNRSSHIPKRVAMHDGVKAIFTNEVEAKAEIIPHDFPLGSLSANAGLTIAYKLALLAAPLATGKGAQRLIEAIEKKYAIAKAEAQDQDRRENFNFVDDEIESEFVEERMS